MALTCPCNRCTKVPNPWDCNDKNCIRWRNWFVEKWDAMRVIPRLNMEKRPRQAEGLVIGGRYYALPHRVENYLNTDPCKSCLCPRDLCVIPCRLRRDWLLAREQVLQQ